MEHKGGHWYSKSLKNVFDMLQYAKYILQGLTVPEEYIAPVHKKNRAL